MEQAVEVLHQLVDLADDLVLNICLSLLLITLLVHNLNLVLHDTGMHYGCC